MDSPTPAKQRVNAVFCVACAMGAILKDSRLLFAC